MITTHKYVSLRDAMDYVLLGWVPSPALEGTNHGRYAVLMSWVCPTCAPVFPKR